MDETGAIVQPAFPEVLPHSKPREGRLTRLDLARWLTSKENPLTARVFVNRMWKLFFGAGLSRKLDDQGAQGDWPSHPKLLDWLAGQFVDSGWDVKQTIKLIVMSRTYRQSSALRADVAEVDPENRWLARQGRFRLDAEMVRDSALKISGLLAEKVGGPSVKPYQPRGLLGLSQLSAARVAERHGRRALSPVALHPLAAAVSASGHARLRRSRPRRVHGRPTALQHAVAVARADERSGVCRGGPRSRRADADNRRRCRTTSALDWAFRRVVSRRPTDAERAVLAKLLDRPFPTICEGFRRRSTQLLAIGEHPVPSGIDHATLAAWTSVCRTLLNLHEAITRN